MLLNRYTVTLGKPPYRRLAFLACNGSIANRYTTSSTCFEVWESEVRNRIKTEADINDSELQHGGPHMVEVRYE